MVVNTQPSLVINSERKPGDRSIRRSDAESCGRKAVATPPEDRVSAERKEVRKSNRGQVNPRNEDTR